jgi:hypothetical protein
LPGSEKGNDTDIAGCGAIPGIRVHAIDDPMLGDHALPMRRVLGAWAADIGICRKISSRLLEGFPFCRSGRA